MHTGGESKDPEVITIYESRDVIDGLVDLDEDGVIDSGDDGIFETYMLVDGWVDTNLNGVTHEEDDDGNYRGIPVIDGYLDMDGDVDGSDLTILAYEPGVELSVFAADFGRTDCCEDGASPCERDFDGDCDVDGSDLATFLMLK